LFFDEGKNLETKKSIFDELDIMAKMHPNSIDYILKSKFLTNDLEMMMKLFGLLVYKASSNNTDKSVGKNILNIGEVLFQAQSSNPSNPFINGFLKQYTSGLKEINVYGLMKLLDTLLDHSQPSYYHSPLALAILDLPAIEPRVLVSYLPKSAEVIRYLCVYKEQVLWKFIKKIAFNPKSGKQVPRMTELYELYLRLKSNGFVNRKFYLLLGSYLRYFCQEPTSAGEQPASSGGNARLKIVIGYEVANQGLLDLKTFQHIILLLRNFKKLAVIDRFTRISFEILYLDLIDKDLDPVEYENS
jgi:hypothetical protein